MGQPRPEDALEYARFLGAAVGAAVEEAWSRRTPPLQLNLPISEADQLALEAARAKREAIEQGRATPRPAPPEEKTTCLHTERALESSAPPRSTEPTEAELTAGELSSLAQMAAADRETLENKRLQRLTPVFKART